MTKKLTVYSWAFYDFANTIFSAVVLTFYFPLYFTGLTHRNLYLGLATTAAMVIAGLVVPWLGALSDRTGKTKMYLIVATIFCVIFTSSLTFFSEVSFLILGYLAACFFYHASLVFYFSLLPVVAPSEEQGFASGLGTGLGYLGVLFAIPIAQLVSSIFGLRFVFLTAALLFLIFSFPLFLWVPERRVEHPTLPSFGLVLEEAGKVFKTVRSLLGRPPLLFFFLGNFFLLEAMNTTIFWFIVYCARVFRPAQNDLILLFLALNFAAFLAGLVAGFLTDRWGSKKTLLWAAEAFFVTLFVLGLTQNFWIFTGMSLSGGALGLAGNWTAARKRVVELVPSEEIGEYFGLYNLTTKISVVSSLIFSILADRFGFRAALLSLTVPSGLGVLFLWLAQKESD